MRDHDTNKDKGMKSMMWMMAICCGLPLVLFLFVGAGGIAAGASKWLVISILGVMVIAHVFMMRRGHKHKDHEQKVEGEKTDGKDKDDHSGHSCCR